ncbi:SDR family oxidoreductase [Acetobacteraceae bacterium KSS8]|uniref:SDR family oxidoreductase n=1 Tax=Endosaccharibacter trunci TaxID=2812733 RepID=A0ABT1W8W7_9PROT|nr:SDR family oxidoreductase [Acetobacteraceae bacterium KSS8]
MRHLFKPLSEQRLVLTGATSGIGLATARMAARQGASLMLVARNEGALLSLRDELRGLGIRAEYCVADVADHEALKRVSARTIEAFGGYDSWINNAGAFIYGAVDDVPVEDQRRLFDVVYWGVVHGTMIAAEHLQRNGGAIVTVGSVLGEFAIPFQGTYCAAKFAVKGFTEAYRRELMAARRPVSVTLVKPAAIDTSYMEHARNRLGTAGTRNPPPSYHPDLVARAILHGCETGVRDLVVGGMGGESLVLANRLMPRVVDRIAALVGRRMQSSDDAGDPEMRDNLCDSRRDLSERSTLKPFTRSGSLLLEAQLQPVKAAAITGGATLLYLLAFRFLGPRR